MLNLGFSELESRLSTLLANAGVSDYDSDERSQAINDVLRIDLMQYKKGKWGHLYVDTDLTFASGVASLPSDFNTEERLYEENSDGSVLQKYDKVSPDTFIGNHDYTYTVSNISGTQKFKIYPEDTVTLKLWYYKLVTIIDFTSTTTNVGFDYKFAIPIAQLAAAREIEYKDSSNSKIIDYRNSAEKRLDQLFIIENQLVAPHISIYKDIYDNTNIDSVPFFNC